MRLDRPFITYAEAASTGLIDADSIDPHSDFATFCEHDLWPARGINTPIFWCKCAEDSFGPNPQGCRNCGEADKDCRCIPLWRCIECDRKGDLYAPHSGDLEFGTQDILCSECNPH